MREFFSNCELDTEKIGANLAKECSEGDYLALYGEMGSGKTVFMRGFVGELVPFARVSSPTYAILNVYEGENICVNHFDMYRITSEDDLYSTGYEDVIKKGITVCEWSENIEDSLPCSYLKVVFEKLDEGKRKITVERINL
ncbi:MAG: tRNA (adenosine(37)-N6)-threonylcarbamoyltransferase complex ATPase subunit type 1 TsaE [Clostridia bacterium]|nr:tRNA (adenosine(37)-N6)-threonylcarbamoyltransferase complex ATPase subunit type 1 TsaE [Clostridia bacterium]